MPSSLPPPNHDETLVQRLQRLAEARPERALFVYHPDREHGAQTLSAGDTHQRASALAAELQGQTRPGDRVLLLIPNGLEFHVAFMACLYAGVVAVPAYVPGPRERRGDKHFNRVAAMVRDCQPTLALSSQLGLAQLQEPLGVDTLGGLRVLATDAVEPAGADLWRPPAATMNTPAFLQYTSGSTSEPKGVVLTHGNIVANQALIASRFQNVATTRIVSWLPVHHDMGLCCALLQGLYTGALSVFMSPLSFLLRPLRWLELITRYQAHVSGAPNFAYDLCVARANDDALPGLDLRSWRLAFNGSEPVRAETMTRFSRRFEAVGFSRRSFFACYGLAEATLFVSGVGNAEAGVQRFDRAALGRGEAEAPVNDESGVALVGCGRDFDDTQLRIVDPDALVPCPAGRVGEIWVCSSSVGIGYWNSPRSSQETFAAQLTAEPERRFLRTGDLGFIHEGMLFVTGRLKDILIVRGANYYPQDIERIVEAAHPALAPNACAAFAVDSSDGEMLVVVSEVRRGSASCSVTEIEAAVRVAVADKLELQVHQLTLLQPGSIPRTSSGKVRRRACRAHYERAELARIRISPQGECGT